MSYCMYLRKSRADEQADISNRFDTLQRHEDILFELSRKLDLKIEKVFREIVSGDSIEARPVMQELLFQVEKKLWDGVFVIEVERLARGDTVDQGVVARTFKYSGTKIITPLKIYDPCDEFDEEYFEFGLFMSRREYKVINRRLQRGRLSSVKEGKYPGSTAPFGYKKIKLSGEKGFSLEPVEEQAKVVKLIFNLFLTGAESEKGVYQPLGLSDIAGFLNCRFLPSPRGGKWTCSTLHDILSNPVYCGQIRWAFRPALKFLDRGRFKTVRPRKSPGEYLTVNGIHRSIIEEKDFLLAQKKLKSTALSGSKEIKNSLAGLIICGKCGAKMVRKNCGKYDMLICPKGCGNVGSRLSIVEEKIFEFLKIWLRNIPPNLLPSPTASGSSENIFADKKDKTTDVSDLTNNVLQKPWISQTDAKGFSESVLSSRLRLLENQLSRACSLFEQGIYSKELFQRRKKELESEIFTISDNMKKHHYEKNDWCFQKVRSSAETDKGFDLCLLQTSSFTPKTQNQILKELIFKAEYTKEKSGRWHCSEDNFLLDIYPKLPAFL